MRGTCGRRAGCHVKLRPPDLVQADVAVLDEIDSGLDIDALRDVADAVNGLKRPESATIMVTHYKVACRPLPLQTFL